MKSNLYFDLNFLIFTDSERIRSQTASNNWIRLKSHNLIKILRLTSLIFDSKDVYDINKVMKSNLYFNFHIFTDSERIHSHMASNNCIQLKFYTVQASKLSLLYEIFECEYGYRLYGLSLQTEVFMIKRNLATEIKISSCRDNRCCWTK